MTPASRPARGRGGWQRDARGDDSRSRPPGSRGAQRVRGGGLRVPRDGRRRNPPSGQRPPPRRRRLGRNRGRRAPPSGGSAALRLPAPPAGPAGGSGGPGLSALRPVPSLPVAGGGARCSADGQGDPTPAVTPGRRWQRDSVKRVRKGSGRERGTVGAVRPRAPRCPRSLGRRLPHSGFPRQKPAAAGGRSVRGRRSAAAYGGAARSPRHPAAGRHPRVGRGRRDSAGNGRRGNRDRGAAGRPR